MCNPPWKLLDYIASKLKSSRAAAIGIAPKWPQRPWFAQLSELATKPIEMPPEYDLFSPKQQLGRGGGVGPSVWSVVAFTGPRRRGCS